jgi:hypothetical protein
METIQEASALDVMGENEDDNVSVMTDFKERTRYEMPLMLYGSDDFEDCNNYNQILAKIEKMEDDREILPEEYYGGRRSHRKKFFFLLQTFYPILTCIGFCVLIAYFINTIDE